VIDPSDYDAYEPLIFTVWNDDIRCTECGVLIPAGTCLISLWPGDLRHEVGCHRWTPVIVPGGGAGDPEQLRLPFLAAVEEQS
jgi:hypothetical protein